MISKPEAHCPRCGGRFTVLDPTGVSRYAETVTYYCECSCGAASLTVTRGEVTDITPCPPVEVPDDYDEPEYPEYMEL